MGGKKGGSRKMELVVEVEVALESLHTFRLTILTQKRRIANNTVIRRFHLRGELHRLFKVVVHEFFEHGEAVVVLEECDVWAAFVLS
jgi:hypothetical protein